MASSSVRMTNLSLSIAVGVSTPHLVGVGVDTLVGHRASGFVVDLNALVKGIVTKGVTTLLA